MEGYRQRRALQWFQTTISIILQFQFQGAEMLQHSVLLISSSKYYEKEALLMDPVDGPILASLLGNTFVLPCFDSLLSKPVLTVLPSQFSSFLVRASESLIALAR